MRRSLTVVGFIALVSLALGFASPAGARPWIELQASPLAPDRLANPGGTLEAHVWIHGAGAEHAWLEVSIFDPSDHRIYHDTRPQAEYYDLNWTVPRGTADGIYHYVVELVSSAGILSSAEGDVVLGGLTSGLCSYKFIDIDGNGIYDPNIDQLATGWEICVSGMGCKVTGASYTVCWFFLPVGEYTICETQQAGFTPSTPPCQTIRVGPREIVKVEFGNMIVPPTGACCYPDGSCLVSTEAECLAAGGIYQGNDTSCSPNPCPQPTGACCYPDGHCAVSTHAECLASGGTYFGDLTDCDPNPCTQPSGACCFPDGQCLVTTEAACLAAGGIYQGTGTDCDPNPCPQPTGACCYPNGTCQVSTQAACLAAGGTYYGNFTDCDPNPCAQPLGACCLESGTCEQLTMAECEAQHGMYIGDGVPCGPTTCPPTGVERTTWGEVKHLYR